MLLLGSFVLPQHSVALYVDFSNCLLRLCMWHLFMAYSALSIWLLFGSTEWSGVGLFGDQTLFAAAACAAAKSFAFSSAVLSVCQLVTTIGICSD